MPNFSILYDPKDYFTVLGYAKQDEDGILYVADDGSTAPADLNIKKGWKLQANIAAAVCLFQSALSSLSSSESSIRIYDDDSDVPSNVLDGVD